MWSGIFLMLQEKIDYTTRTARNLDILFGFDGLYLMLKNYSCARIRDTLTFKNVDKTQILKKFNTKVSKKYENLI